MSKQEQIMKAELERKQRLAKYEASEKASQAKANSRKDAPWLQPNIIVKASRVASLIIRILDDSYPPCNL